MTTKEQRTTTPTETARARAAWSGVAARFDEHVTPHNLTLGEEALRRVGLRPGMRFLDVAAGSGALSLPAARLGARVLATDLAPAMIERLEARARDEGLAHLEARVMDGYALDLEDDAFDVAGSQHGVSLFPDLERGLGELVRVTKPGGRVLIVAFGALRNAEFLTFFVAALRASVPGFTGLPIDPPPLPFQLADPTRLRDAMTEAGLADVRVETGAWAAEFRSAGHLWDTVTASNPIAAGMVADLTRERIAEVQQVLDGMLRERSGGEPAAVLTTEVHFGIGTK